MFSTDIIVGFPGETFEAIPNNEVNYSVSGDSTDRTNKKLVY